MGALPLGGGCCSEGFGKMAGVHEREESQCENELLHAASESLILIVLCR